MSHIHDVFFFFLQKNSISKTKKMWFEFYNKMNFYGLFTTTELIDHLTK